MEKEKAKNQAISEPLSKRLETKMFYSYSHLLPWPLPRLPQPWLVTLVCCRGVCVWGGRRHKSPLIEKGFDEANQCNKLFQTVTEGDSFLWRWL